MLNTNTFRLNSAQLDKSVLENLNTGTESASPIKDTLNTVLKSKISNALTEDGYTVLTGLIQHTDPWILMLTKMFRYKRSWHIKDNSANPNSGFGEIQIRRML